jgi:TonB family protein
LDTIQGRIHVGIRIAVDSSGNVSNAEIESSPSAYFANRALEAARRWKFKPAGIDSQNASREWLLHFEFTQTGSQLTSAEPYR